MIALTLAIAASVAAGVGAHRRWGARAEAGIRRVMDALLYLVVPFITFFVIARTELTTGVGVGLVLAYLELAIVGVAAWALAVRVLRLPPASAAVVVIAVVCSNTGFLGIPLNAVLLGSDALGPAITFDTVVTGPMFSVGAFAVAAAFTTRGEPIVARLRAFAGRNAPLAAVLAALVAPDALAPDLLVDIAETVAVGLAPIGFFVLGVTLASEAGDGAAGFFPRLTAPVVAILGLRLVAAPLLLLGLAAVTVDLPDAYLVQAAMPVAIATLLVSHAFDLDLTLAAAAIAWSTTIVVVAAGVAAVVL